MAVPFAGCALEHNADQVWAVVRFNARRGTVLGDAHRRHPTAQRHIDPRPALPSAPRRVQLRQPSPDALSIAHGMEVVALQQASADRTAAATRPPKRSGMLTRLSVPLLRGRIRVSTIAAAGPVRPRIGTAGARRTRLGRRAVGDAPLV